jgi:hypothetical protein
MRKSNGVAGMAGINDELWSIEKTNRVERLVTRLNGQEKQMVSLHNKRREFARKRELEERRFLEKKFEGIRRDILKLKAKIEATREDLSGLLGEDKVTCSYFEVGTWAWIKVEMTEEPYTLLNLLARFTDNKTGRVCGRIGCLCPGFPFADAALGAPRGYKDTCRLGERGLVVVYQIMEIFPLVEQIPFELFEKINGP